MPRPNARTEVLIPDAQRLRERLAAVQDPAVDLFDLHVELVRHAELALSLSEVAQLLDAIGQKYWAKRAAGSVATGLALEVLMPQWVDALIDAPKMRKYMMELLASRP